MTDLKLKPYFEKLRQLKPLLNWLPPFLFSKNHPCILNIYMPSPSMWSVKGLHNLTRVFTTFSLTTPSFSTLQPPPTLEPNQPTAALLLTVDLFPSPLPCLCRTVYSSQQCNREGSFWLSRLWSQYTWLPIPERFYKPFGKSGQPLWVSDNSSIKDWG